MDTSKFKGHTSGPWKAIFLNAGGPVQNEGWEIFTPDYDVAAWITRGAPIRKKEDAALIAAAPDLLAEVERLRSELGEWVSGCYLCGGDGIDIALDGSLVPCSACDHARALLRM